MPGQGDACLHAWSVRGPWHAWGPAACRAATHSSLPCPSAQRLRPVTLECPKVLLPLVNTPMLDYTLEWLAINEVEEVGQEGRGRAALAGRRGHVALGVLGLLCGPCLLHACSACRDRHQPHAMHAAQTLAGKQGQAGPCLRGPLAAALGGLSAHPPNPNPTPSAFQTGLAQVYVFVCAHAEAVLDHLESAGWASDRKFKLHTVVSTNCLSVGDALRVMDGHDTVKSDFILVAGACVLVVASCEHGRAVGEGVGKGEGVRGGVGKGGGVREGLERGKGPGMEIRTCPTRRHRTPPARGGAALKRAPRHPTQATSSPT